MTADPRLPCREGDHDDWFISKDGKQYSDDEFLTDDDLREILERANEQGLTGEDRVTFIEKATDRAEADAKTAALRRRRHAREACHTSCPIRTRCLQEALDADHQHGTWGGYYEEEIRELRREIRRRKRAREG